MIKQHDCNQNSANKGWNKFGPTMHIFEQYQKAKPAKLTHLSEISYFNVEKPTISQKGNQ